MESSKNEVEYNDDLNYVDEADSYRSKRAIDPDNLIFQVKNPNIKKILTNKLATLLEEMDAEEYLKKADDNVEQKEDNGKETRRKEELDEAGGDNMLHLAMHNILLQGIIGHMDLNDVYKKVHLLIRNFYDSKNSDKPDKTEFVVEKVKTPNTEEHKFFEELLKCKTLHNQLSEDKKNESQMSATKHKEPKLFIKTIIEINENRKFKKENDSQNKDIIGLIKLIYNGKSIRFERMDDNESQATVEKSQYEKNPLPSTVQNHKSNDSPSKLQDVDENLMSNPVFNKIIETYLKEHDISYQSQNNANRKKSKDRLKRQIKIHYVDRDSRTQKPKLAHDKIKKDDEELYIEIETHFDGKGSKGEKKKKLVRSLIDKIQKAIHEDGDILHDNKESFKHIKVKKRNQDPIKPKVDYFLGNVVPTLLNIDHRDVDPIGKIVPPVDNILDYHGDGWKRRHSGPAFLTASKSVNSAEMGELTEHYDNMLKDDIPKRIQKPINMGHDYPKTDDMNNVTFYLKDIDGSGFSVGFNQYVDEQPDVDSLKLFNGLENLIQEYHKSYDTENISNIDKNDNQVDGQQKYAEREQESIKNSHDITRRSVNSYENSNTYKYLLKRMNYPLNFHKNTMSSDSVNSLRRDLTPKRSHYQVYPGIINIVSKPIKIKDLSIAFNNNFYSNLRPQTIKVDSLLKREKRSLTVKKISNIKSKIKLNKFINTKTLINKRLFLKSQRNKREINKIRIIARDPSSPAGKKSNENLYQISPENLYLSKSAVKETDTPDTLVDESEIQNSDILPLSAFLDLNYPNQPASPVNDGRNLQQAALMSKYPHIFFDEVPKSEENSAEEKQPIKPYRIQARSHRIRPNPVGLLPVLSNVRVPGVEDIVNAILPQTKSNYRVTVKISPKNVSNDLHSGFKEVHTSVNKSYDKNGLRYFSTLNVSQISKIENLNESVNFNNASDSSRKFMPTNFVNDEVKQKEDQIKVLFELHKKRIDAQLDNLQRERIFLENLLYNKNNLGKRVGLDVRNYKYRPDEYTTPMDYTAEFTTTTVRTSIKTTTTPPLTAPPLTAPPTLKTTSEPTIEDKEKELLLTTINHNDNATKEILRKIDDNTILLRIFLNKLSNFLESNKPTTETAKLITSANSEDWKNYVPNNQLFRQVSEFRNSTHTIPFIYTFSQPAETNPSLNAVYSGNLLNNIDLDNQNPPMKAVNPFIRQNQSRFFIDELENINADVSATIKINTTHA